MCHLLITVWFKEYVRGRLFIFHSLGLPHSIEFVCPVITIADFFTDLKTSISRLPLLTMNYLPSRNSLCLKYILILQSHQPHEPNSYKVLGISNVRKPLWVPSDSLQDWASTQFSSPQMWDNSCYYFSIHDSANSLNTHNQFCSSRKSWLIMFITLSSYNIYVD